MLEFTHMNIYIGHASSFNYKEELYKPIQDLKLNDCNFILPHANSTSPTNSKEQMKSIDLMIAETTHPSTGLGIELAWAEALGKRIVCIHQKGSVMSPAVLEICREVFEYDGAGELGEVVRSIVG
jgi:hypothetical protein